ncbi:hypothetical protein WL49_00310 [Burkholderia ubonensis]|nr:hypothetical protein WL49_00310 [Burkholderia ubonensis]
MVEITSCVALRMAHLRTGNDGQLEQGRIENVDSVVRTVRQRSIAQCDADDFEGGLCLLRTSGGMAHVAASYG